MCPQGADSDRAAFSDAWSGCMHELHQLPRGETHARAAGGAVHGVPHGTGERQAVWVHRLVPML